MDPDFDFDFDDPMFTLHPSGPRRWFSVGVQGVLGCILIYVAFVEPPASIPLQLFLIVIGALALAGCSRAWAAASGAIVLRPEGLVDHEGRMIAALDEIAKVDRALFSFKPSNGFLIKMNTRQARAWTPGMWWRFGYRVGIGGILPGAQTKLVADTLTAMVDRRDRDGAQD